MTLNGCQNWHKMVEIHKNLIFQLTDKDDSHDKNVIRPDFKNLKQVWEFYQFWHAFWMEILIDCTTANTWYTRLIVSFWLSNEVGQKWPAKFATKSADITSKRNFSKVLQSSVILDANSTGADVDMDTDSHRYSQRLWPERMYSICFISNF